MTDRLVWEVAGWVPSRSDGSLVEACTVGFCDAATDAENLAHDVLGKTLSALSAAHSDMRLVEDGYFMDSETVLGASVTRHTDRDGELTDPVQVAFTAG